MEDQVADVDPVAMKRCLVRAGNTLYVAVLVWADKEASRCLKKLRADIQSAALN